MKTQKRPAASAQAGRKKAAKDKSLKHEANITVLPGAFKLREYIKLLTNGQGVLKDAPALVWSSSCDGMDPVSHLFNAMGVPNEHLFGAECDTAAATFVLSQHRALQPQHLYQARFSTRRGVCF